MVIPAFGLWFTLLALLPWGLRLLDKAPPYRRTPLDGAIVIFLVTTWIGYWASYDKSTAWVKAWLIMTTILLYFALSAQPKRNLGLLSFLSFALGLGVSIYFFLTEDLAVGREGFAFWWMSVRPEVWWPSMPHGYVSGLIAITSIFAVYMMWETVNRPNELYSLVTKAFLLLGIIIVVGAFVLTWSGGVLVAGVGALGVWILWKISTSARLDLRPWMKSLFPALAVASSAAIIIIVYLGPANMGGSAQRAYGENTRAELFARGAHFLADYPITGAGLNSFPGLYSQYMIGIPFYYFPNSYNMFLDVAIEQGLMGGLALIFLYAGSVWLVCQTIIRTPSAQIRFFCWLSLFALVIAILHGSFYDFLYNDKGTLLLLFPVGISMSGVLDLGNARNSQPQLPRASLIHNGINLRIVLILLTGLMAIVALQSNKLVSIWYANVGAVKMSQIELSDFPTNRWVGTERVADLTGAEPFLLMALHYDPNNQTANHRLGLISMARQDFDIASVYLEQAHQEAPGHRGIIKTLAYCYVWLGKTEKARLLLAQIPESRHELETYVWWWQTQGRADLAIKASTMISGLEPLPSQ